jgi:hypothetical protein
MTTRTLEATVRWAIETLDANPYHQGARAILERTAAGSELHAAPAREALTRAERGRAQQPPPTQPAAGDWPAGMRRDAHRNEGEQP